MIRCGKIKGKDQCVLFTKDGTRALGYFLYSEHGGMEGAKAAANDAVTILLPAFDKAITDNEEIIAQRGAAYWNKVETGIIDAAKKSGALYNAVEAMVLAA